jgi:NAD(P)H-dependent flavin oxidoreductase YrpB (nitropropane dioxygenase family)
VKLEAQLTSMVPDDHRRFARRILEEHGIPETPADQRRSGMMGWTEATGKPLLAAALRHDKVRLIANALGTPPSDVIAEVQASGRLIGALAGSVKHALHHKEAGLDFIVCQGTEGGGHTGEIGSLVLWPEVIDAVSPLPVLAAGGVGTGRQIVAALAMGAQGVWTGTLWLTVEEAETPPGQMKSLLDAKSSDAATTPPTRSPCPCR